MTQQTTTRNLPTCPGWWRRKSGEVFRVKATNFVTCYDSSMLGWRPVESILDWDKQVLDEHGQPLPVDPVKVERMVPMLVELTFDDVRQISPCTLSDERVRDAMDEYNKRLREQAALHDKPKIVCLCGSGRFKEAFDNAEYDETLKGRIVLTIGCNTKDVARNPLLKHHKPMLDELHKRKIDIADEVLVLNVGGYIGTSTRSEIEHAEKIGKPIRYLEPKEPGSAR